MADIRTLFESLKKLKLPEQRLEPEALGLKIRESMADDRGFEALLKKAAAARAYTAPELIAIYNRALDRNERFGKSASKKKILEQLRAEREIMLSNDLSRETIKAHSKGNSS
ncbi:MAG: hypothetical protein KF779_13895 [Hyphomonadaceae bacterium]|nr:hypothetical protein [Hyphomonadaceae bacterium]